MNIKTLTVSEVNNYIKRVIDDDLILSNLSVKGEISNLKFHSSGHIYFALKDKECRINCVMFKSRAMHLKINLKEGMEVIIKGRASLYPAGGSMQIYCDSISKEGEGELFRKFEELKLKLESKGWFDIENKKSLPAYPKRIGVVTSPTGAVIQDIINVTKRRNPMIDIVLYPAKVQGTGAYKEVIEGIKYFNKLKNVDLIIAGRGGGSIEELWNFNEEDLAEAVFKSKLPVISAVGHEVDFTICDFVSDMRAATPSQAAEIAVPLYSEMKNNIRMLEEKADYAVMSKLKEYRNEADSLDRILKLHTPLKKIQESFLKCDTLKEKMDMIIKNKINVEKSKLQNLNSLLIAHNPLNVMNKGYAIIEDENNKIIKSVEMLNCDKNIKITLNDGSVEGKFSPSK